MTNTKTPTELDIAMLVRADRIEAIPPLIAEENKRLTAFRAEERTVKRKISDLETKTKKLTMQIEGYKAASTASEKKIVLDAALLENEDLQTLKVRLEQIAIAKDKATFEKEVLDHERKALKAVLEGRYAEIIDEALSDAALAAAVRGAMA